MNYDKIGEFIQTKRKEKHLTQKELADKIGVTDKAVSKWERGLGCPDVSILEVLADILDVSILELLKGRMIENEVIKVTEMNDYVKETINYSKHTTKEKIKNIANKIIVISVVFISCLLFILNIINMYKLNHIYTYNFNDSQSLKLKENYKILQDNISKIKNNQGIFSDEDYKKIKECLDNLAKNIQFVNYNSKKEFKMVDINYMNYKYRNYSIDTIEIARILEHYDKDISSYRDYITYDYISRIYTSHYFYEKSNKSYKYSFIYLPNAIEIDSSYLVDEILTRVYISNYKVMSYIYLTNTIMEVGEINE